MSGAAFHVRSCPGRSAPGDAKHGPTATNTLRLRPISHVPGREVTSKRHQDQGKRRAEQNSQGRSRLLAHIPDIVPVRVAFRMRGIRRLGRARQKHKPRDGPANRRNPRNLSEPLKPALHAALIMAWISAAPLSGSAFISSRGQPRLSSLRLGQQPESAENTENGESTESVGECIHDPGNGNPCEAEPPTAPQNKYAAVMPGHSSERKAKSVSGSMARSTDEMSAPMANAMMRFAFTESIKNPAARRRQE